jgi:hypothetical protein
MRSVDDEVPDASGDEYDGDFYRRLVLQVLLYQWPGRHPGGAAPEVLEHVNEAGRLLADESKRGNARSHGRADRINGTCLSPTHSYLRDMGFQTNDLVELVCTEWYGRKTLRINGSDLLNLRFRPYLLMEVLTRKAIELPGEFIRCTDLIDEIEILAGGLSNPRGQPLWQNPTYQEVYRQICALRSTIQRGGGNPNLIERGPRGTGYRLSTPSFNIHRVSPMPEVA